MVTKFRDLSLESWRSVTISITGNFDILESITVWFEKFHTQIDFSSLLPTDIRYLESYEKRILWIPLKWKLRRFTNFQVVVSQITIGAFCSLFTVPEPESRYLPSGEIQRQDISSRWSSKIIFTRFSSINSIRT